MNHVFVVSDGSGRTAQQIVEAALTQFAGTAVDTHLRPGIRTQEGALEVVQEASQYQGFIVHTVVSKELRDFLLHTGRQHNVSIIDLMGPLLAQLSHQLSDLPSEKPGLFAELNRSYFQRIECMEFAFHHDDGQRVQDLPRAEIVLVGVSRTFKTPLSIYLAFKGWLVANVPIIFGIDPPEELFDLPSTRVFCLSTEPVHLVALRQSRDTHLRGSTGDYVDVEAVRQELLYAHRIFSRSPHWPVINVTHKPIEEIASEILSIMRQREAKSAGKSTRG